MKMATVTTARRKHRAEADDNCKAGNERKVSTSPESGMSPTPAPMNCVLGSLLVRKRTKGQHLRRGRSCLERRKGYGSRSFTDIRSRRKGKRLPRSRVNESDALKKIADDHEVVLKKPTGVCTRAKARAKPENGSSGLVT